MSQADHKAEFYREARSDLAGPLDGVRIVEVTSTWAGPRCGCLLADYGADVVKVEQLGDPDVSHRLPPFLEQADPPVSFFDAAVNRNKRNVALDLTRPAGRDVLMSLVMNADVLVENYRPGRMKKLGCGYDDVRKVNARVVYVSISGYGQYGPYRDRPGYDPQAQALSGLMWLNATGDEPPMKSPIYLSDELAGLHAAIATLAALRHRDAHGEGQHVDVSLIDATVASCTGQPTLAAQGQATPRWGNNYPFAAPANVYRCRDGWFYGGVLLDAQWAKLAALVGRPELATHSDYATLGARLGRREELDALMAAYCAERTRGEVVAAIKQLGLVGEQVLTPGEMVDDEHIRARGTIQPVRQASGAELKIEGPAARLSRTPVKIRRAPPQHGMDTEQVLADAGFDEAARARLKADGII